MSGLNAAPPRVVPGRRGRPGTWLRGRATPASADRVHARRWAILAVLCLSVFLALVDNTIVDVALPSISKQLHATTSDLQWIVDAYSLVFASLLLVGGAWATGTDVRAPCKSGWWASPGSQLSPGFRAARTC